MAMGIFSDIFRIFDKNCDLEVALSHPLSILLFMIIEIARRAETAATELLTAVGAGTATCDELREVLRVTRSVAAVVAALQTTAAELIARRERHGDGGAELLASSAGLAQRDARDRVNTAQTVRKVPELYEAVQSGKVSQANARRLAEVITKTGSDAVAADGALLEDAQSLRPEQFVGAANRWIASQQADNGVSQHAQQRAKRYLRFFDTEDGMVGLHGEFDKITGQRLHNRLRQTATRLLNADKQLPEEQRRKFPQCMADALQHHTSQTGSISTDSTSPTAGRFNKLAGASGRKTADAASIRSNADTASAHRDHEISPNQEQANSLTDCDAGYGADAENENRSQSGFQSEAISGGWVADITVLARVDDAGRDLIYELSDGSRLPPAVVEELTCNARLTSLIYERCGDALWRTRSRRTVTETQWQSLLATYGGCFHCGAAPAMCQAHHITPYSQGGATSLDNLIMVCWSCHHRIHHDNWQIHEHPDGSHTLHPPQHANTRRYGPAHAEDWPKPPELPHQTRKSQNRNSRNRKGQTQKRSRDRRDRTQNSSQARARDPATNQQERSTKARDPATNQEEQTGLLSLKVCSEALEVC